MSATTKTKAIAAAFKHLPANKVKSVSELTADIYTTWRDTYNEPTTTHGDDAEMEEQCTAVAQVLGNDDLLHMIFQHSSVKDIQNLRLCSHLFESVAAHYLFRRLTIGYRKRYVRRLRRVAAVEKFSRGVRRIVFERVSYSRPGTDWAPIISEYLAYCDIKEESVTPRDLKRASRKFAQFAQDQDDMEIPFLLLLLRDVIRRFQIECVEVTQWAQGGQTGQNFWDVSALLGDSRRGVIPIASTIERVDPVGTKDSEALLFLLASLGASGQQIKELVVRPTNATEFGFLPSTILKTTPLPGMMVSLGSRPMPGKVTLAVRGLRKLHLDLAIKDTETTSVDTLLNAFQGQRLRTLFKNSTQLEDVFVKISASKTIAPNGPAIGVCTCIVPLSTVFDLEVPYTTLRRLHLGSFWLEAAELCTMIETHASSLEHLTLTDINLGGTKAVRLLGPGVAILARPQDRQQTFSQTTTHEEWLAVADTCQKTTRLQGLLIESPSVSADWTYLPLSDAEDLMEMGMGGNVNELYSDSHWSEGLGW